MVTIFALVLNGAVAHGGVAVDRLDRGLIRTAADLAETRVRVDANQAPLSVLTHALADALGIEIALGAGAGDPTVTILAGDVRVGEMMGTVSLLEPILLELDPILPRMRLERLLPILLEEGGPSSLLIERVDGSAHDALDQVVLRMHAKAATLGEIAAALRAALGTRVIVRPALVSRRYTFDTPEITLAKWAAALERVSGIYVEKSVDPVPSFALWKPRRNADYEGVGPLHTARYPAANAVEAKYLARSFSRYLSRFGSAEPVGRAVEVIDATETQTRLLEIQQYFVREGMCAWSP